MRFTKSAMLIGLGASLVLAYQKYGSSMKEKACDMVDNTMYKIKKNKLS